MSERTQSRYQTVAANLGREDVIETDRIAAELRSVGWPYSNRSLVLREAVSCLRDALQGKSREEIFRFFISRTGRRAQSPKGFSPRRSDD